MLSVNSVANARPLCHWSILTNSHDCCNFVTNNIPFTSVIVVWGGELILLTVFFTKLLLRTSCRPNRIEDVNWLFFRFEISSLQVGIIITIIIISCKTLKRQVITIFVGGGINSHRQLNASHSEDSVAETAISKKNSDGKWLIRDVNVHFFVNVSLDCLLVCNCVLPCLFRPLL